MSSKNMTLKDYQNAGEEIFHKLHLNSFPVSIKYIKDLDKDIPPGVRRPIDNGEKVSICQAFS
ncbi:MAG: hypothetical protein ACW98X_06255 [Promethearchaeota archaeon]|jgi:uncharacterized protein (DUF169 family)